ncbi:MAG: hypothetical protein A2233_04170 [Candidatus Kerfeldbacteria bacterium RIFOXYA2_FULL_38_24]|uniref:Transcription regulator TrmB N-terminal domain-containing protein n=1 Tax=Candidatus Kerfeldbacteria bacterium RIFOXYB2_FULL_38_14 TaxID=1798547 RepID=A0A1G2BE09_9BACT|nr:MAG: hypothetical protein A2233_04170 [Candidatus Kerfeldbacteria bacterium RIFOXYA2_FULL_38_24]OGY86916.1 MAG: hypothetical protein A2319_00020 [Candidatus Kerfeldbacteria bacterium RIFOXYB2_FULL_38_14]
MITFLKSLGFTGNEAKIYLALLELGVVTTKKIIQKTSLSRGQVYDCLDSLEKKGFVMHLNQDRTKYFKAVPPKNLQHIIAKEQEALVTKQKNLQILLPRLEATRNKKQTGQELSLYTGQIGLKTLFFEWLDQKDDIYVIGGYRDDAETMKQFLPETLPDFHRRRIEKKMKFFFIFPSGSIKRANQVKNLPLTKVRILPTDFAAVGATHIRGDVVDIVLWSSEPIGITIKNKELAVYHKQYFDFLWKMSKPLGR